MGFWIRKNSDTINAPLELIAMYLNEKHNRSYKINPMLEAIEESIMHFYIKSP